MSSSVSSTSIGEVHRIQLDDGKANALSPELLEDLGQALDAAEKEASAVVIAGRPGRFSAGFELSIMGKGGTPARNLVTAGAELCLRLLEFPKPVVIACTGHAIAGGALVTASGDLRLGARGPFKITLNEVAIGISLPHFGREIARARLSRRHLVRAVTQSQIYDPEAAVDAGFLDETVESEALLDRAVEEAGRLGAFDPRAFAATKRALHSATVDLIRRELAADMEKLLPG